MSVLNERIKTVSDSATLRITSLAKKLKSQGEDVVSFGAGEPDFDTPDYIKEKAIESIKKGDTKYTPAAGTEELKKAVANKLKTENNLDYEPGNIVISCGAKHSIYNVIDILMNPGDEVIIFSPYWVSYPEMIKLAGGKPVIVDTVKTQFKLNLDELKKKITKRTKLVIINSPQNPSGVVYSEDELKELAAIILEHKNLMILSDEIYEHLIYDKMNHISIAQISPDIKERVILVNGLSKTYSMTGWRIGYLAAPKEIADAVATFQSHTTSNPTTFCQTASVTALTEKKPEIAAMINKFEERRNLIYSLMSQIKGLNVIKPQGAFYIFPDITLLKGKLYKGQKILDGVSFTEILLKEKKVAVIPGDAFGCNDFIRLSFATSDENIIKGLQRIKEFVEELK